MKCPKCSYVSFDYNQICPKCNKDIGSEQKKLNLPAFKPTPPSLLSTLTGEASESQVDLRPEELDGTVQLHRELGLAAEDLTTSAPEELSAGSDSEALELRLDDGGPEELAQTVSIDRAAAPARVPEEVPLEEALLDLKTDEEELLAGAEEASPAEGPAEGPVSMKDTGDEEIVLDLSELETRGETGTGTAPEEALFAELKPEDLEETPKEQISLEERPPAGRKVMDMDTAEMVTMEIDKGQEGIERELEDLDLEMDLEAPSDKRP